MSSSIKDQLAASDGEVIHNEDIDPPIVTTERSAEERHLRNKIDLMILPIVCILYLMCFIDRANIGNARLAGFEKDLGMTGYDYNKTLTMFYISYIIFEVPSNIICKWMGPGWFLPLLTLLFGACSIANGYVNTVPQAMAVRFLLGIFEAGMLPGIAYYLTRWYRRSELTFRLACYIATAPIAGAFGALLASAILTLDSFGSVSSWRMIFAIEGIVTMLVGFIALFILTDSPASARWLSPAEKELAEHRVRSERVGQSQVIDKMDKTKLMRGVTSPVTLVCSVIYFFSNITVQGFTIFAPSIIRTLFVEKTVVQQQLLTAPPYVSGTIFTLIIPLISWKIDKRQIFLIIAPIAPVLGFIIFLATSNLTARYIATFFVTAGIFVFGVLPNSQISANLASDTARSSGIGFNVMIGNIGGLVSTWSFLDFSPSGQNMGNGINLASQGVMFLCAIGLMYWMRRDNRVREDTQSEKEEALRDMSQQQMEDLDWKHPTFRWRI